MADPVVIDNGSETIKVSLARDHSPRLVFPGVVGLQRHTGILSGWEDREFYIGQEAIYGRGILAPKYPIKCGIVNDWDSMEKIWYHTFCNELGVVTKEHAVLFTESPFNPKSNREKTCEIIFETFDVPAMFLAIPAVLSLYASASTTGIVLDSGADSTVAVPVYEGFAIPHAISRLSFGGRDLFYYFTRLAFERPAKTCNCGLELSHIRDLLTYNNLAYVAQDFEQELELAKKIPSPIDEIYELPCGHFMTFGSEKFKYPEALFQPSSFQHSSWHESLFEDGEVAGVHEMIFNSIMKCDIGIRNCLFETIMLAGGSTLFPGFVDRITKEVRALGSSTLAHGFLDLVDREIKHKGATKQFKIVAQPNRKCSACVGGSVLASLSTFEQMCISRSEYWEYGPSIVHRKCF